MKLTQRQIALVISKDRDQVALILMVYLMSLVDLKLVEEKMEIVKKRHHLLVWREELRRKEILGTLTLMVSGRREYQQVVVMEQERTINLDVVFTRPKQNASHLLVMMDLEEHNGFREWIVQSLEIKMLEIVDLLHHV
jgi:hypothetical protein